MDLKIAVKKITANPFYVYVEFPVLKVACVNKFRLELMCLKHLK